MIDFREIYIAELKAVGFSASDAEEIAAWYLGAPGTTPFSAHCRRVDLAASGYDPSQPRNADGEWTAGGGSSRAPSETTEQKRPKTPAEYRKLAETVPSERVVEICRADRKQTCEIHEALAVLRTNPKVRNSLGEYVTFGSDMGEKYLSGRGRPGNVAQPERLKELPLAMYAVAHDKSPKLQYLAGAIHDPLNPPRGTQRVYTTAATDGPMLARAWADSGKVTGWYVEKKKPAS